MPQDFLPTREAKLLDWSHNMAQHLSATPDRFGMNPDWTQQYQSLHDAFDVLYTKANHPSTRTPVVVEEKNRAKAALIGEARRISAWIQAQISTTDEMRRTLGLTVPKKTAQRIKRPSEPPTVHITGVDGFRARLLLVPVGSDRPHKPEGVAGAAVFRFVGDEPPRDLHEWTFVGNVSTARSEIEVPSSANGVAQVWLSACWYNPRGEYGPASQAVSGFITRPLSLAA